MEGQNMAGERYRGRLIKWNGTWGFIKYDGKEAFIHLSNCVSGFVPELNAPVEFELTAAAVEGKPPQAFRVRSLRKDSEAGLDALRRGGLRKGDCVDSKRKHARVPGLR